MARWFFQTFYIPKSNTSKFSSVVEWDKGKFFFKKMEKILKVFFPNTF